MKNSSLIKARRKLLQPGTDRPRCGGEHYHQSGVWGTTETGHEDGVNTTVEKSFTGVGLLQRVMVDETPASGRFCRSLRQGGSAMVPGFKPWSGRWIKIVPGT